MNASIIYAYQDGTVIGNHPFPEITFPIDKIINNPGTYTYINHKPYLTVANQLDYCNYYIITLVPSQYVNTMLKPLYITLFIILLGLALFFLAMLFIIKHFVNAPAKVLHPVLISMQNGEFHSKIEGTWQFEETGNIINSFNDMIHEIQELRINVYEQQIAKTEWELQYLKTQIAPHFLINCLNTIFVLSQDKANIETTQQLISTLSQHLRYAISSQSEVSLSEEIEQTKNYLLLTSLRFPGSLTYSVSPAPELLQAKVFPLMLLMLTENSIKANLVMGEAFHIDISGQMYEEAGLMRVHLTHIDSGTGFSEENLLLYNHITEASEVGKDGYGIGIYNTIRRLRLYMGESAKITFSNEPGLGARIDLDFPYQPY